MCGRYTALYTWEEIHTLSSALVPGTPLSPRFNLAPSQLAPVVREINGERRAELLRWGLIPSWAKDSKIGYSLVNARADGVAAKPSFRSAFKSRRCLVPASGFYEWKKPVSGTKKQPFYITLASGEPIFFAGLWEKWEGGGEPLETFTIITTEASADVSSVHDRMPVILSSSAFSQWLSSNSDKDTLLSLLKPYAGKLSLREVSTTVNNVKNDTPSCIVALSGKV